MIVVAEDGVRIRVWDPGLGDPVLLIPDWSGSGIFYEALADAIERGGLAPMRFDPRGTGRSDRPEHGYSVTREAEDAALVLEGVLGQGAWVAGHGYGARVALRLAEIRPDLVRGLVLIAPALLGDRVRGWDAAVEDERRLADLVATSSTKPISPPGVTLVARDMAHTTRPAATAQLQGIAAPVGPVPRAMPIGVVAGEFDDWTPIGVVRRTLQDAAGDRWRLMVASGHYLAWEDPDALARAVQAIVHPSLPEPILRAEEAGTVVVVDPTEDACEPLRGGGISADGPDPLWPWEEKPAPQETDPDERPPADSGPDCLRE